MRSIIKMIIVMVAVISTASCTRKVYIPVQNHVRTVDTIQVARWHTDSIHLRDSIYIDRSKDTVKVYRYRILESLKVRVDTIHDVKIRTVEKEIPIPAKSSTSKVGTTLAFFLTGVIALVAGILWGYTSARIRQRLSP